MIKGSDKIRRDFTITKLTKSLRPLPSKTQENSPLSSFALNEEKAHKYVRNFINENTQKVSSRELTPKGKTEETKFEEIPHKFNSTSIVPGRKDGKVKITSVDGTIIHLGALKTSSS